MSSLPRCLRRAPLLQPQLPLRQAYSSFDRTHALFRQTISPFHQIQAPFRQAPPPFLQADGPFHQIQTLLRQRQTSFRQPQAQQYFHGVIFHKTRPQEDRHVVSPNAYTLKYHKPSVISDVHEYGLREIQGRPTGYFEFNLALVNMLLDILQAAHAGRMSRLDEDTHEWEKPTFVVSLYEYDPRGAQEGQPEGRLMGGMVITPAVYSAFWRFLKAIKKEHMAAMPWYQRWWLRAIDVVAGRRIIPLSYKNERGSWTIHFVKPSNHSGTGK